MDCIEELIRKYPRLLHRSRPTRSQLNPGWLTIADRLFQGIDQLLEDEPARGLLVGKIREKCGVSTPSTFD